MSMKLYYHPVSTVSRPVAAFISESRLPCEFELVDLFTGQHLTPEFASINPSRAVPVLEDDGFILSESSAILKYLADKADSPLYPKAAKARARVNERMDWFNTGFYRDYGYGLVYPQIFPHHKRPDPTAHSITVDWGRDKANAWLKILDERLLGADQAYLCGDDFTIADHFGAALMTVGEVVKLDFTAYPNVARWIERVKARPTWAESNQGFYTHFVAPFQGGSYVGL